MRKIRKTNELYLYELIKKEKKSDVIVKLEKSENSVCHINSVVLEVILDIPDIITHFNLDGVAVEIVMVSIVFGDVSPFEIVGISIRKFLTVVEVQLVRGDARDVLFPQEMSQTSVPENQVHLFLFPFVLSTQALNRTLLIYSFLY